MNAQKKTYKVINTTRFPGARSGKHRLGFFIDVLNGRPMGPGKHIIANEITPGMMAMQRQGFVAIQEVKDMDAEIGSHLSENAKMHQENIAKAVTATIKEKKDDLKLAEEAAKAAMKPAEETSTPESSISKEDMKDAIKADSRESKAIVSMGELGAGFAEESEDEGTYPDGEPNFIVQAGKKGNKKK
jgi:hypothetical protein